MTEPRRIFIGVPVTDSIPGLFLGYHTALVTALYQAGWLPSSAVSDTVPLDKARQNIFDSLIAATDRKRFDYMLWLDSDMLVLPKHVFALIEYLDAHPDFDAASGLYFTKGYGGPGAVQDIKPVAFDIVPVPERLIGYGVAHIKEIPETPAQIDGVGLGILLMRVSSIKEKLMPAFGKLAKERGLKRYFWFDSNGEDQNFCAIMKHAGMRMALLPDVDVPHIGSFVNRRSWNRLRLV